MKTRIISALVALPLLIFIVVSGGLWMHLGIALLGLVGMYEFNKAISKEVKGTHIIAYLFGLVYLIFIDLSVLAKSPFVCQARQKGLRNRAIRLPFLLQWGLPLRWQPCYSLWRYP